MVLEGKIYCAALLCWRCEFVNKNLSVCGAGRYFADNLQVSFLLAAAELAAALGRALLV